MKSFAPVPAALAAAALSLPAFAQQPSQPPSPMTSASTSARQPWYGGISVGEGKLDNACVGGFSCDEKDTSYRLFAGTHFNRWLGLELGATQLGKFDRGGGETKAWAGDLAATVGIPLGNNNSSIFAKLGAAYTETRVDGAGLPNGKERDWSPRWGVGGQLGLSQNWALRADWDRYNKVSFAGGREQDIDTLMLGVQYTFR